MRFCSAAEPETPGFWRMRFGRRCRKRTANSLAKPVTVYLGFWTDKGNADEAALNALKNLRNKNVFLFGTAGFGVEDAYFQRVLNNVKASMDESNTLVGKFMCQGKMQQAVRDRYVKMKEQPDAAPNLDQLIDNFDRALFHPDAADLENLRQAILK